MEERNNNITYIKAIAIMLMVIGHASYSSMIEQVVVHFHVPLFFFVSGYCLKDIYFTSPFIFYKSKIKGIWWPYVKWGTFFILLHNLFFHLNIYNDTLGFNGITSNLYDLETIRHRINRNLIFCDSEQLLGGYWFLKCFFWANILSFSLLWILRRFSHKGLISCLIMLGLLILFNIKEITIPYIHLQARDFASSFLWLVGYCFSIYKVKPFPVGVCILSAILLGYASIMWKTQMVMPFYPNNIMMPYLITAILVTWSLYSIFDKCQKPQKISKALVFIGNNTLCILTWHLISFKVVSLFLIGISELSIEHLAEFPVIVDYSLKGWWIVYSIVGIIIPCGLIYINNRWIKYKWLYF